MKEKDCVLRFIIFSLLLLCLRASSGLPHHERNLTRVNGKDGHGGLFMGRYKSRKEFEASGNRCGTTDPTVEEERLSQKIVASYESSRLQGQIFTVPVYWNDIRPSGGTPSPYDPQISIDVLNAAYSNYGFQFNLVSTQTSYNTNWYNNARTPSVERDMKSSLRQGGPETLNVYMVSFDGLLGFATFPFWYAGDPDLDGVVCEEESAPQGTASPYNEGDTLVHEVGTSNAEVLLA